MLHRAVITYAMEECTFFGYLSFRFFRRNGCENFFGWESAPSPFNTPLVEGFEPKCMSGQNCLPSVKPQNFQSCPQNVRHEKTGQSTIHVYVEGHPASTWYLYIGAPRDFLEIQSCRKLKHAMKSLSPQRLYVTRSAITILHFQITRRRYLQRHTSPQSQALSNSPG